jgi:tRNA pseudouridine32 synthase/23S rRNA pseudouridine746 synthase
LFYASIITYPFFFNGSINILPIFNDALTMSSPLPIKNGLAASYIWLPQGAWDSLLPFLLAQFPNVAESVWVERMLRGEVVNQRGEVQLPQAAFKTGDCIYYYREVDQEVSIPFQASILFQDNDLLVVDKPHFLPVIPTGKFVRETLLVRLKQVTGIEDLVPLHRLDRETAGVMLFSVNPRTRGLYQSLFQQKLMHKTYEAIAGFDPALVFPMVYRSRLVRAEQFFLTAEVAGESNSETHIALIERMGHYARYRLNPVSGKKHQLRVHLMRLGIPIVNDVFYPVTVADGVPDDYTKPLKLLAKSIHFVDPITGRQRHFESMFSL